MATLLNLTTKSAQPFRAVSLRVLAGNVAAWRARRDGRLALARLDSHLMRDIGLDAMTCAEEASLPFWR